MSSRHLSEKYGNSNTRTRINRAIRAELVGGGDCLDALHSLDSLKQKWKDRGWTEGLPEINRALQQLHKLHAYMRAEIRARYGMPPEEA